MGLLIMIVIFLALWKILGTLGHIFLPILAV
ncbi:capsule polysaccharide transpoter, partial [Lactiplantibacillus plantarum]